ncbi:hypothetical protein K523DRAFT_127778 [Schizophyllum commune Tattone D]|nr:hypothetical protein K523DRAFT_127778 [Schizophyllum commune Tattone D]
MEEKRKGDGDGVWEKRVQRHQVRLQWVTYVHWILCEHCLASTPCHSDTRSCTTLAGSLNTTIPLQLLRGLALFAGRLLRSSYSCPLTRNPCITENHLFLLLHYKGPQSKSPR